MFTLFFHQPDGSTPAPEDGCEIQADTSGSGAGVDEGPQATSSPSESPVKRAGRAPTGSGVVVTQCGQVRVTCTCSPATGSRSPFVRRSAGRPSSASSSAGLESAWWKLTICVVEANDLPNEDRGGTSNVQVCCVDSYNCAVY